MKRTILIGGARAQKLPSLVLENSILDRTASKDIKIVHGWSLPPIEPKKEKNRSRTGFSFQRFALPWFAEHDGYGIYLDSDMLVLVNIDDLFDLVASHDESGSPLICTPNLPAVIGMNCHIVQWFYDQILKSLDDGVYTYEDLLNLKPFLVKRVIPNAWNALDAEPLGTKLIHYTDMSRQCWRAPDTRMVSVRWQSELYWAVQSGRILPSVVKEEVDLGHIIPDALKWIKAPAGKGP